MNSIRTDRQLIDVKNPQTWKLYADKRFTKFSQTIYYKNLIPPKNIILFIGDGMSISTITGARYMKADLLKMNAGDISLIWDNWPVTSLVHTFNSNSMTTDSASSATAFLCGAKAHQYVVGLTGNVKCCKCRKFEDWEIVQSSLAYASKAGLSTGIVTTTRITHATPAAGYGHNPTREWEGSVGSGLENSNCTDLASQLVNNAIDFNVILGGGAREFYNQTESILFETPGKRTDSRNIIKEWTAKQYAKNRRHQFVYNKKGLSEINLNKTDYVFGLFASSHLDYAIDNPEQITLAEMTKFAIQSLSRNPKGYLLLIEGGRIDHGHHGNRAKYAITETLALEKAVEQASDMVDHNNTLFILTADHSHSYGIVGYSSRNISILDVDNSQQGDDGKSYLISAYFNGPAGLTKLPRNDPSKEDRFKNDYRQQSLIKLSGSTHNAEDVPLYAIGPYSELFHSGCDNTFIAHATMYSLCIGPYTKYEHCKSNGNIVYIKTSYLISTIVINFLILFYPNFIQFF